MSISDLMGKTLTKITQNGDDELVFEAGDGTTYRMWHRQDCCEFVEIDDICGDLADLLESPILRAEERESEDPPEGRTNGESDTWTFYELATIKGSVTIRWHGSSNGHYSESVDFQQVTQ